MFLSLKLQVNQNQKLCHNMYLFKTIIMVVIWENKKIKNYIDKKNVEHWKN